MSSFLFWAIQDFGPWLPVGERYSGRGPLKKASADASQPFHELGNSWSKGVELALNPTP